MTTVQGRDVTWDGGLVRRQERRNRRDGEAGDATEGRNESEMDESTREEELPLRHDTEADWVAEGAVGSGEDSAWPTAPLSGSGGRAVVEADAGGRAVLWAPNELHQDGSAVRDRRAPAPGERDAVKADASRRAVLLGPAGGSGPWSRVCEASNRNRKEDRDDQVESNVGIDGRMNGVARKPAMMLRPARYVGSHRSRHRCRSRRQSRASTGTPRRARRRRRHEDAAGSGSRRGVC